MPLLFTRLWTVSNNRAKKKGTSATWENEEKEMLIFVSSLQTISKFCLSVVGVKNVRVNVNCLSLCEHADACTCARCECWRLCVFTDARLRMCALCRGHSKCVIGAGWAGGRNSRNKRGPVQPRDCSMNHPGTYTVAGQSSQPSAHS